MDSYPEFFIRAAEHRGVYNTTKKDAHTISQLMRDRGAHRILDIPCGFGRITGPLHKLSFDITGVDSSKEQIAYAKRNNSGPEYQIGNMLNPPEGPFDAILNIYTSFGYMASEEEDKQCLKNWFEVLRPGGLLLIETLDTERVASIDESEKHLRRNDGVFVRTTGPLTEYIYTDPATNIMSITYSMDGQEFTSRTRLYHRDRLLEILYESGFSKIELYSSFDLEPVATNSHTVFFATR